MSTYGTYKFFFKWEQVIQREYKGLFSRSVESEDRGISQVSIDKRWSWLAMVDRLANGDITKHDEIFERNYIECLNLLSYWHERDLYMKEVNKIK